MRIWFVIAVCMLSFGCRGHRSIATEPCGESLAAGAIATCTMPQYPDRSYDVFTPKGDGPHPVLLAIHGGGGNRTAAIRGTCPNGDVDERECLHQMGTARGYVVVSPDGTSAAGMRARRSWNGGGGSGDWRCTGGRACEESVDEHAYFVALLDDVGTRVDIDRSRLYVTGISNGGTMSHRLACQLEGVRAVFAIGGTMQWTTGEACVPPAPVAVAHAHGTEDPCWPYEGGPTRCPIGQRDKNMKGVDATMREWAQILGCGDDTVAGALPNAGADDTSTATTSWNSCRADLRLLRIEGGGHTWPNGYQYLPEGIVGVTPRDWGNEVILDWFDAH